MKINSLQKLKIMMLLSLLNVFYISFFVMKPGIESYKKKLEIKKELLERKTTLQEKIDYMQEMKSELEEALPYAQRLDATITDNENLYVYILDIVRACAESGFIVEKFNVSESSLHTNSIEVTASGNPQNLGKLTEKVESLERLTVVDKVYASLEKDDKNVKISLRVFKVEKSL